MGSAVLLLLAAVADVWAKVVIAGRPTPPTQLEAAFIEIVSLTIATGLAFVFGYAYSAGAASAKLRAQGRSSFRRLQNLFAAIRALGVSLSSERESLNDIASISGGTITEREMSRALDMLELHFEYQVRTATDVVEDWRDIVPKEVEELERRSDQLSGSDG